MNEGCVVNPKTGRAVKKTSALGKKLLMSSDITLTEDCVINPKTGRAVRKTSALGKKLINASTTITQAVKIKIAKKKFEKAKVEAKPKTPPAPKPNPKGGMTKGGRKKKEPKAETPPQTDKEEDLLEKYIHIMSLQKRIRDRGAQMRFATETALLPAFMTTEEQQQFFKQIEKAVVKWEKQNEGKYLRWNLGKDLNYANNIAFMYDVFDKAMELDPDKRLKYFMNLKGVSSTEAAILLKTLEHLSGNKKDGGEINKYFIR